MVNVSHILDGDIVIMMEFCKASTQRLKVMNKQTYTMYIEVENVAV